MPINMPLFVLCQRLGQLCLQKNRQIALAESCTGGTLAACITEVPGVSHWFNGSAVVYSNIAKTQVLGVDPRILAQYGAVSEPVAKAMAQGALEKFQSTLALSITGVAGPDGGTQEKPVGMVCFALADKMHGTCKAKTLHLTSGRGHIRSCAAKVALEWLLTCLGERGFDASEL